VSVLVSVDSGSISDPRSMRLSAFLLIIKDYSATTLASRSAIITSLCVAA